MGPGAEAPERFALHVLRRGVVRRKHQKKLEEITSPNRLTLKEPVREKA